MVTHRNLFVDQGSTFIYTQTLLDIGNIPLDLNGYTIEASIRKHPESKTSYPMTAEVSDVSGEITLSMTYQQTTLLPAERMLYDVEVTKAGIRKRILQGSIVISPNITQG